MASAYLLAALSSAQAMVASLEEAIREEDSATPGEQPISVKEAAFRFGLSERQARRLAEGGLGTKVGGRWHLHPSLLLLRRVR